MPSATHGSGTCAGGNAHGAANCIAGTNTPSFLQLRQQGPASWCWWALEHLRLLCWPQLLQLLWPSWLLSLLPWPPATHRLRLCVFILSATPRGRSCLLETSAANLLGLLQRIFRLRSLAVGCCLGLGRLSSHRAPGFGNQTKSLGLALGQELLWSALPETLQISFLKLSRSPKQVSWRRQIVLPT